MAKKFRRYVYSFWDNPRMWHTDRHTDTARRLRLRLMLASCGKNVTLFISEQCVVSKVTTNVPKCTLLALTQLSAKKYKLQRYVCTSDKQKSSVYFRNVKRWQVACHNTRRRDAYGADAGSALSVLTSFTLSRTAASNLARVMTDVWFESTTAADSGSGRTSAQCNDDNINYATRNTRADVCTVVSDKVASRIRTVCLSCCWKYTERHSDA